MSSEPGWTVLQDPLERPFSGKPLPGADSFCPGLCSRPQHCALLPRARSQALPPFILQAPVQLCSREKLSDYILVSNGGHLC